MNARISIIIILSHLFIVLFPSCKKDAITEEFLVKEEIEICSNNPRKLYKIQPLYSFAGNNIYGEDTICYCFTEEGRLEGVEKFRDESSLLAADYNHIYTYGDDGLLDKIFICNGYKQIFTNNVFRGTEGEIIEMDYEPTRNENDVIAWKRFKYDSLSRIIMMYLDHPLIINNFSRLDTIKFFWAENQIDSIYNSTFKEGKKFYYSSIPNSIRDDYHVAESLALVDISGGNGFGEFLVDSVIVHNIRENEISRMVYDYELDNFGRVILRVETIANRETYFKYDF